MVDRLELLNKHVTGNCSAVVVAEGGDAAVVAQVCKELARPQVGRGRAPACGVAAVGAGG